MTIRLLPARVPFVAIVLVASVATGAIAQQRARSDAALKIVVVEGEGAVNIIQQKTAVAPVIEVRDRNDQPVAGATVNFVVRAGRASFSGARTLTVTTNAAGRAAAAGLSPSGAGALQIGATASFQGQTAAAVIAQTNVMTAAEAAAASTATAGGAGSGSTGTAAGGGAGAGGGGGMSLTTIGIIGGAAAAGAVVAKQTILGGTTFKGDFNGVLRDTIASVPPGAFSCTQNESQSGTLTLNFDAVDGPVSGTMNVDAKITLSPGSCQPNSYNNGGTDGFGDATGTVTGSRDNVQGTGHAQNNYTNTIPPPGGGINAYDFTFTGRFTSDSEISGSLTVTRSVTFRSADGLNSNESHGTVTHQVTLRKQ